MSSAWRGYHRIFSDPGQAATKQGTRLLSWWDLDFVTFRREVEKALKQEIPLRQRGRLGGVPV